MVTALSSVRDSAKQLTDFALDYTIPRTKTIAAISAFMGIYAYRFSDTYLQNIVQSFSDGFVASQNMTWGQYVRSWTVYLAMPLGAPEAKQTMSPKISIAVALITSVVLNFFHAMFGGMREDSSDLKKFTNPNEFDDLVFIKLPKTSLKPKVAVVPVASSVNIDDPVEKLPAKELSNLSKSELRQLKKEIIEEEELLDEDTDVEENSSAWTCLPCV